MTNARRNLFAVAVGLGLCLVLVVFSTLTHGEDATYEVKPAITLPEYKTDEARAMEAYERLMNRLMDMSEKNFSSISTDVKDIARKLDSIGSRLTELALRIERIEKAMGLGQCKLETDVGDDAEPKVVDGNVSSPLN